MWNRSAKLAGGSGNDDVAGGAKSLQPLTPATVFVNGLSIRILILLPQYRTSRCRISLDTGAVAFDGELPSAVYCTLEDVLDDAFLFRHQHHDGSLDHAGVVEGLSCDADRPMEPFAFALGNVQHDIDLRW